MSGLTSLPKGTLFYSKVLKDFVVDGVCQCGHLEREHGSVLTQPDALGTRFREAHGGNCVSEECSCPKFRWERWITQSEFMQRSAEIQVGALVSA